MHKLIAMQTLRQTSRHKTHIHPKHTNKKQCSSSNPMAYSQKKDDWTF